jgi:Disulfide bond formation protein DsbB.
LGTFGFFSLIAAFNDSFKNLQNIFIFGSLFFGVGVTSRQIYIQNLSSEGLTNLSGCGMPLETTIEFYGFFGGIYKTLQGGPSCAEEGWRFIFNFAEWGLIFFLIFIFVNLLNVFKVLKKV